MSSPAPALRDELTTAMGNKSTHYWDTLSSYLGGKISRTEFEELIREAVDTPHLVKLHNSLIISVLGSSLHHAPPTPPPDAPGRGKPSRKRRRTLLGPDAGADGDPDALHSSQLKRWAVGMGKKERERMKLLENSARTRETRPKLPTDEIASERGVQLPLENGNKPGTYLPVNLASVVRGTALNHILERVTLISAQHNLQVPSKTVAQLMTMACEAKLKQLISQALALTSTSNAIASIQLSSNSQPTTRILTASSFETLFTVRPAVLPYQSAAATRLMAEGASDARLFFDHEVQFKERHTEDPRWQILALLAERSTVRDALLSGR